MDKKPFSFLFSTRLMAFLFFIFAVAMGVGTFVEDYYNTDTARIWIYNAWWFEGIMLLFLVNFLGNIKRYNLLQRKKWATLLLHVSFIFILIGAAITRYYSYEGMIHIREGESSNQVLSDKVYLTVMVDGQREGQIMRRKQEKQLMLSPAVCPPFTSNHFEIEDKFDKIPYTIEYVDFIMGAKDTIVPDPSGVEYLKIVETENNERHEHYLKSGEVQNLHNLLFALNKPTPGAINISTHGETYTIQSPFEGDFMRMADQMKGDVTKDAVQPLMMRSLYNVGGNLFVFPEAAIKGKMVFRSNGDFKDKKSTDALIVKVSNEGQEKLVTLTGSKGLVGQPVAFKLGNLEYTLMYGSKMYELPFRIVLKDFIAQKYPGTADAYSSFESKVRVEDAATGDYDFHIYMNHVLDHGGYRFFQANFDPDEKGTILSANHDFIGTCVTYSGYFMLFFAMMAILFDRNTRFAEVKRKLANIQKKKKELLLMLVLFLAIPASSQDHDHQKLNQRQIEDTIQKYKVDEKTAAAFGRLVIQDAGGRMKPINTFSSELLRKVTKKEEFNGMNSDQVLLSMSQMPQLWFDVPLIYIKKDDDSIRRIIGIPKDQKYATFLSFFDERGNYKLDRFRDAYRTSTPTQFQKDFKDVDKRLLLMNSALFGGILKIFPVPNDKGNKWLSYVETNQVTHTSLDTMRLLYPQLMEELFRGTERRNFTNANSVIANIEKVQKQFGSKVRPSDDRIDLEITYNKYDIFKNLFWLYLACGSVMLLLVITNILAMKRWLEYVIGVFHIGIWVLFVLHTLGLIARWYISGHAPWSDAYESMIYVAWATMFFTLALGKTPDLFARALQVFFSKKTASTLTVASGTFVASMVLMIAHWNFLDPAIANLQPVLNSYWLMIHVAVIVASYGPFTLGMVLGVVSMVLMILTNSRNRQRMELHLKEITYINEMALTIGLVMLTIGNFLGGQWANESWGRYWSWDPKETWALTSIMVYGFVIHARLVPALRGNWFFSIFSVASYYAILMTYFGVNFYLTGLHSYASGEKTVTPNSVFVSIALFIVLGIWSRIKYNRHFKK